MLQNRKRNKRQDVLQYYQAFPEPEQISEFLEGASHAKFEGPIFQAKVMQVLRF